MKILKPITKELISIDDNFKSSKEYGTSKKYVMIGIVLICGGLIVRLFYQPLVIYLELLGLGFIIAGGLMFWIAVKKK